MTASSELFVTEEIRDILEDLLKKENLHVQCPKDWKNISEDAEYPPHGKADVLWGYEPAEKVVIGTVAWDTHYYIERGDLGVYAEAEPVNVKFYNAKGKLQVQTKILITGMRVFQVAEDEKCGSCNWKVAKLYLLAETKGDAMAAYKENERGLCGDCLSEMMSEGEYTIEKRD